MTTNDRCESSGTSSTSSPTSAMLVSTRRTDWGVCGCDFCLAVAVRNVNRARREMPHFGLGDNRFTEPMSAPGWGLQGWALDVATGWDHPVFTVHGTLQGDPEEAAGLLASSRPLTVSGTEGAPIRVQLAEAPRTVLHGEREICFDD